MQKNKILIIFGLLFIVLTVIYFFYQDDIVNNGRTYRSKQSLCQEFVQSYLRTVQRTDNAHSSSNTSSVENERWQMAIDVETELYNLCLVDLNKDALRQYKPDALRKYQQ